jgi:hypothetical protein
MWNRWSVTCHAMTFVVLDGRKPSASLHALYIIDRRMQGLLKRCGLWVIVDFMVGR